MPTTDERATTKVAVVGCGYWGPNLVRNFQRLESCQLTMCCDLDTKQLAVINSRFPTVKTTTSIQEVLESNDVDAVVLATPVKTHHRLGKQVLLHSKHLLVEKPLAFTSKECEDMIATAAQKQLVLMAGHLFMYHPAVRKLKEIIDSGAIGNVYYMDSQRLNLGRVQTDINAMWSLAPHDVSIAMYLLGQAPVEVSARGGSYLTDGIQDVVYLSMTFPGGVTANAHVSWLDPNKTRKLTIVGSRQMVVYDDTVQDGKVMVHDKRAFRIESGQSSGRPAFELHSGEAVSAQTPKTEPLAAECAHFVECIREGRRPLSDGQNGLRVVRVLEAAQRSLEAEGMPIRLTSALALA